MHICTLSCQAEIFDQSLVFVRIVHTRCDLVALLKGSDSIGSRQKFGMKFPLAEEPHHLGIATC